jgi:hypothetical protein
LAYAGARGCGELAADELLDAREAHRPVQLDLKYVEAQIVDEVAAVEEIYVKSDVSVPVALIDAVHP